MSKALELARELVKQLEERENCSSKDSKNEKVELSTLNSGETFMVGKHEFIVLEQVAGTTKVISKKFMAKNVKFGDSKDYKNSNLKKIIEKDIQPIIEKELGEDVLVGDVVDLTSVDMQNEYGKCDCKVRPITFDEARKYNELIVNEELDDWWWTCTPWSTEKRGYKYSLAVVSPRGGINGRVVYGYGYYFGVRPFCILKSNIFVSKGE